MLDRHVVPVLGKTELAELMRRGGHANPAAALRYQHATENRDAAIAAALSDLAAGRVTSLRRATTERFDRARIAHGGDRSAPVRQRSGGKKQL